jgi:zinc/manganese transport system ATP-binding protein
MQAGEPVIRLDNVYTAYEGAERPTLADITMSVHRGEFVIIGGPNGAGKTTLLETVNGMLTITHGTAHVCGHNVRTDGVRVRRRVGYLLQNFAFDPLTPFTVEEVVLMGRYGTVGLFRKPKESDIKAAEHAIRLLGIEDLTSRSIGKLSGGQQQKVLLAQNLARNPDVLLLDEPFSNLDMFARESINNLFSALVTSGVTVLMVSHAFDDLPHHTVRVVVMHDGAITLDRQCTPDQVEGTVRDAGRTREYA